MSVGAGYTPIILVDGHDATGPSLVGPGAVIVVAQMVF